MNYSIVENAIRYQCSRVQFCEIISDPEHDRQGSCKGDDL